MSPPVSSTPDDERTSLLAATTPTTIHQHGVLPNQNEQQQQQQHSKKAAAPNRATMVVAIVILVVTLTVSLTFYGIIRTQNHSNQQQQQQQKNMTFGHLAASLVYTSHVDSVQAVRDVLVQNMRPDDAVVEDTRKRLLRTRNLLDVFSPVYPNNKNKNVSKKPTTKNLQSDHKFNNNNNNGGTTDDDDMWVTVRLQYKKGYEILGQFIDLNHAHILYDTVTCDHRRQRVLDWKTDFLQYCADDEDDLLDEYLRQPLSRRQRQQRLHKTAIVRHAHESKFFWKGVFDGPDKTPTTATTTTTSTTTTIVPFADAAAVPCLRSLAVHQLHLAQSYLNGTLLLSSNENNSNDENSNDESLSIIQNHSHVETLLIHETFHNLRKTLRALCDEYEIFGPLLLLLPPPSASESSLSESESTSE
jgi:CHAD domain-containing protein